MTYRDLDKVLTRLEERESAMCQALEKATSHIEGVAEDLGFVGRAIDVFDHRQEPDKKAVA